MQSADDGAEQFMFRTGQLRKQYDLFWSLQYKNYHGLQSVSDIPFVSIDTVCRQRLSSVQFDHYFGLIKYLSPLMKDSICFQLLSMVMLLDTSTILENNPLSRMSSIDAGSGGRNHDISKSSIKDMRFSKAAASEASKTSQRFHQINSLQKHYIRLFYSRCMDNCKLRGLGETDEELKRTMLSVKQIANYTSLLLY